MKGWNDNTDHLESYLATDTEIIMAFTHERILSPEEIFSKKVAGLEINRYRAHQIVATDYSTYFRPTQKEWKDLWVSPYVWTAGRHNTDLSNYFATIKNDDYWRELLGAHLWKVSL